MISKINVLPLDYTSCRPGPPAPPTFIGGGRGGRAGEGSDNKRAGRGDKIAGRLRPVYQRRHLRASPAHKVGGASREKVPGGGLTHFVCGS